MYVCLGVDVGVLHLEQFISIPAPSHNVSCELQSVHQIKQCSLGVSCQLGMGMPELPCSSSMRTRSHVSYKNRVWSMKCNSSPHLWANPTIHLTEYTYQLSLD